MLRAHVSAHCGFAMGKEAAKHERVFYPWFLTLGQSTQHHCAKWVSMTLCRAVAACIVWRQCALLALVCFL